MLSLYSCTNKVLLYFLSQPRHSQEEKEAVVRMLQTFLDRWDVVMATYNSNVNFITCLLRCLLLIRSGRYVWHVCNLQTDTCGRVVVARILWTFTQRHFHFFVATPKVSDAWHRKRTTAKLCPVCLPPKPDILHTPTAELTLPQV